MRLFARYLLCVALGLSMGGCTYLGATRDGTLFPSTRHFWHGGDDYFFPQTLGGYMMVPGFFTAPVGPFIFIPIGGTVHVAEGLTIAPAVDTLLMPYDLCLLPGYLERERQREEKFEALQLARWHVGQALDDPRYLSGDATIQGRALQEVLSRAQVDFLNSNQVARLVRAHRANPSRAPGFYALARQNAITDEDLEFVLGHAYQDLGSADAEKKERIFGVLSGSRRLSDRHLEWLEALGMPKELVERARTARLKHEAERVAVLRREEQARQEERKRIEEERLREERRRRLAAESEAAWQRIRPTIDAIAADVETFRTALDAFDDERVQWGWVNYLARRDPWKSMQGVNLALLLDKIDEREAEGAPLGKEERTRLQRLRHAALRQVDLPPDTARVQLEKSIARRDPELVLAVLLNPALPRASLAAAYSDRRLVQLRCLAAMCGSFRWPTQEALTRFLYRVGELGLTDRSPSSDYERLEGPLDALLRDCLPPDMPKNWRSCLPGVWSDGLYRLRRY